MFSSTTHGASGWRVHLRIALEAGLLLAVSGSVIAFGGTEPLSLAVAQALLFLLGACLLIGGFSEPRGLRLPVLGPALLLAYFLFEIMPLPARPFAGLLGRGGAETGSGFVTVSLDRYSTLRHGLLFLACLSVFYIGLLVFRAHRVQRRVVLALIALGVAEAFYGLIQFLTGRREIFAGVHGVGTYINRNHFAGLLEMILPLALAMAFYHVRSFRRDSEAAASVPLSRRLQGSEWQKAAFFLFLGVAVFVAIIFSYSRMGIVSALICLGTVAFLAITSSRRYSLGVTVLFFMLAASLSLGAWVGLASLVERFAALEGELAIEGVGRWAIWKDTVALIGQHPVWGVGLGVFELAVTSVQISYLNRFINYAHNDYLQLIAEVGFLGAALLFVPVFWVLILAIRRVYQPGDRFGWATALGAAGGILALLTHSLTDGNLYIPANALVFSLLLALGYSTAKNSSFAAGEDQPG